MDGYSMDWIDRITTEHVASYISDELYDAADEYMEIDYGHEDEVNEGIDSEYGVEDLEYNLDIMDYEDENLVQDPRLSRRLSIIAESTASSENTALATNTESSSSNEDSDRDTESETDARFFRNRGAQGAWAIGTVWNQLPDFSDSDSSSSDPESDEEGWAAWERLKELGLVSSDDSGTDSTEEESEESEEE